MSRALTVLGAVLLFSTAGCLYPHSRHSSRHGTHGSVYVGWRHRVPPPVVHHHGPGCGHVQVGAEWKVCPPSFEYGAATPPPTSGRHDRGLHRGHEVSPPRREQSTGKVVGGLAGVLHETAPVREEVPVREVVPVLETVQEHDGHTGPGKGHEKSQGKGHEKAKGKGHDKHEETHGKGLEKAKGKGHDKHEETHGKGLEKAKGKGHEKHEETHGKGHEKAKGKGHEKHDD